MTKKFMKSLLESGIINADTQKAITEAWESEIFEAKEQVRAELREEYAQKHEHDKQVMVEALDKMITETLTNEINEFRAEKKSLSEDRVKINRKLNESAKKFNDFMVTKLAEEIKEFRQQHQKHEQHRQNLEEFVIKSLSNEIKEFATDKKSVVEAKVKLVTEGKKQLAELKKQFIAKSAKRLSESVSKALKGEITQLKKDINESRKNDFGRKLFEAYASEYSSTYLSKNAEMRKLSKQIAIKDKKLNESTKEIKNAQSLIEKKDREIRIIKESNIRQKTLNELLGTLNEDKAETMRSLLESVQTPKLKSAFDKYLPAVLNSGAKAKAKTLTESKIVITGDKTTAVKNTAEDSEARDNVFEIRRLAGLK
jgi:hypothetical protein